ncbi:MAG: SLBB domain-containing protein [Chitinophagia bacterium]|jgi:protein involved in polysaccharide export with SLBB domain
MMKFLGKIVAVFTVFVMVVTTTQAQNESNARISQFSDQQILQLWQQVSAGTSSESDAMKLLVKKGLKPAEVMQFKKRLVGLQSSKKSQFSTNNLIKDTANFMRDSTWVLEVPEFKKPSSRYGYDFFSNPNISFEPNLRIATPKNYVLGSDDQLSLTLTGLNEIEMETVINPDGNINIAYVGLVNVNGLTIEDAKARIFARMSKAYPALKTKQTQLTINLSAYRSIRVTIIGEAERPGAYQISSLSTMFNALYTSGGPTETGSLRDIQLIRNNKKIASIDLYEFLQTGKMSQDIRLEDQDVIVYPPYIKRVELGGMVKRPLVYELKPNENLANALQYAGGFNDSAFTDRIKIVQRNARDKNYKDVEANAFVNYIPMQGDSIYAEKQLPIFENKVSITGAVYRPGDYGYSNGMSLQILLQKADGLRSDAFLPRATIKRLTAHRDRVLVSVDLQKLNAGSPFILEREDSIQIYTKQELEEVQYVTIAGHVRTPGKILFREGMQIQDVIAMSGGFMKDAAYHRVELSRIKKNRTDSLANQLVDLIKLELDSNLSSHDNTVTVQAQDYIFVPRLLNSVFLGDIKVAGEVLFPGNYALEKRNETIENILERAGGLTKYGSIKDLQVYRKGVLIGVNLDNNNARDLSLLLLPGDSLFISRNDPFVEVTGAVYSPQLTRYESGSFKSYISAAGGVKNRASLAKAYIHYGNGINQKQTKFLFFRFYPRVTPGSKIIVPEMPEKEKGFSVAELSAITSIVSALVGLAAILKL